MTTIVTIEDYKDFLTNLYLWIDGCLTTKKIILEKSNVQTEVDNLLLKKRNRADKYNPLTQPKTVVFLEKALQLIKDIDKYNSAEYRKIVGELIINIKAYCNKKITVRKRSDPSWHLCSLENDSDQLRKFEKMSALQHLIIQLGMISNWHEAKIQGIASDQLESVKNCYQQNKSDVDYKEHSFFGSKSRSTKNYETFMTIFDPSKTPVEEILKFSQPNSSFLCQIDKHKNEMTERYEQQTKPHWKSKKQFDNIMLEGASGIYDNLKQESIFSSVNNKVKLEKSSANTLTPVIPKTLGVTL